MQLSIIIINYRVRFFLEQCLYAVRNAIAELDAEVFVTDNHSEDGSMAYLQPLFPEFTFIELEANLGFAKANNRILPLCKGSYVLFLNPDTLVAENSLQLCLQHLNKHPEAGALGIRMINGKGRFLPESKRAFPTPITAFCKLSGLAGVFPNSAFFNRYALGNLSDKQDHIVDVLAGAFMMVRKDVLVQLNGFDDSFFLYGEDIDLSYRIQQAGFQNLYFSGSTIIHFKGESSANKQIARVNYFYQAMMVFVNKHYKSGAARTYSFLLKFAIGCRAIISALKNLTKSFLLPLQDFGLIWLSFYLISLFWVYTIRDGKPFGLGFLPYAFPVYALWYILSAYFTGLYDSNPKTSKSLLSVSFATISLLAFYSLLPESIRFSRGVILIGSIMGSIGLLFFHQILVQLKMKGVGWDNANTTQTIIVGSETAFEKACKLIEDSYAHKNIVGNIPLISDKLDSSDNKNGLTYISANIAVDEIIFCFEKKDLKEIIMKLEALHNNKTRFLFHSVGSKSMVGFHENKSTNTLVSPQINYRISQPYQKRMKRLIDFVTALFFLVSFPLHLLMHKKRFSLIGNAMLVLTGKRTWVGYIKYEASLPIIKPGIMAHTGARPHFEQQMLAKSDQLYAVNYDWWHDLFLIFSYYQLLGNQSKQ